MNRFYWYIYVFLIGLSVYLFTDYLSPVDPWKQAPYLVHHGFRIAYHKADSKCLVN